MGIATTTYFKVDPLTGAYPQQPQVFQNDTTEVQIGDPITGQGVAEDNPFGLAISSIPLNGLPPIGGITIISAGIADNALLAQYWDINEIISDPNDGVIEFQGVIQEDFREEAIAPNLIDLPSTGIGGIPFPEVMIEGTEISGAFSATEFQATIEGFTTKGDYFLVQVNDFYNVV